MGHADARQPIVSCRYPIFWTASEWGDPAAARQVSEHGEIFEEGDNADQDDDDLYDLPDLAVERQPLDEVKDENDHQEGDQDADQH